MLGTRVSGISRGAPVGRVELDAASETPATVMDDEEVALFKSMQEDTTR